jgi:hypothetical protein
MFFWLFEFLVILGLLFTAAQESDTVKERTMVTYLARVGQQQSWLLCGCNSASGGWGHRPQTQFCFGVDQESPRMGARVNL